MSEAADRKKPEFKASYELKKFATILLPKDVDQPILAPAIRDAMRNWMTELWSAKELAAVGLKPRRTALLMGPPGCGKTTLAHHFAARLGLPLILIRTEQLVSSALGGTGRNIASVFEAIDGQEDKCVILFDEFDSIGTKRTEDNQACAREMNAAVTTLLTQIEAFEGVGIAATNRGESIDPALWRRFGLQLNVDLPGEEERFAILCRYLAPYALQEAAIETLVEVTDGASPALLRQMMESIKRDLVLAPKTQRSTEVRPIFQRIVATIKPPPGYELPPLFRDKAAAEDVMKIAWPPTLQKAA